MPPSTSSSPRPRPPRRQRLVCLAVVWALSAAVPSSGQQVEAVGDLRVEAAPGSSLTLIYRIVNLTTELLELVPEITEPEGWSLLTGNRAFVLPPGRSDVQIVSFALPATAAAGEYVLTYSVNGGDGSAVSAEERHVVVAAKSRLTLDPIEHPKLVLTTDSYQAEVRLTNQSNLAHTVKLELSQSVELPLTWGPSEVRLSPQESSVIRIRVETPPDLTAELLHQLALTARVEADPAVIATTAIETTVLPAQATSAGRWRRLEGSLTVRALTEERGPGGSHSQPNGTLFLGGNLDDEGLRHLELFLQGPEVSGPGPLRTVREELYAQLTTPTVDLIVGDFDPSPSRLVSQFRGRGASLRFGRGIWGLGGRYLVTPHQAGRRIEEHAVHADLELGGQATRLQYVQRSEPKTGNRSELLDFEALLHPLETMALRLGLAHGRHSGSSTEPTAGLGGELELLGQRKRWSYNVLYLYGDRGFPGQHPGSSALYGGVNAKLTQRLSAQTGARQGRVREEPDVLYSVAPFETEYTNGLYYRLQRGTTVSLERFNRSHEEVSEAAAVDLQETTYRLGVRQNLSKGDVAFRVESGDGTDRVAQSTFDLRRYTLESSYRPSKKLDVQAELEQTRETTLDGRGDDALSALVSAKVQLREKLALDGYYRQREREFRTSSSTVYSRVRLLRELPRAHQVSLELAQTRTSSLTSEGQRAVMLGYTVPLAVPVNRRTRVGAIHGRVRSEQSGQPLSNVMIRLGGAVARTDQDGEFSIPALDAGTHLVAIDTSRIGYRLLPSVMNPEVVAVVGGSDELLDLWLTSAGVIRGTVAREPSAEERWSATNRPLQADPEAMIPVAGVVVEASDGRTTLRRLTYADGRFVFDPLQPGTWTLRVVGSPPAGYDAHYADRAIELAAGAEMTTGIRLVAQRQQRRRIPSDPDAAIERIEFTVPSTGLD
jgi:hypothetical protein